MNKEKLSQIFDNLTEGNDVNSLLSDVISEKSREILGLKEEDNSVRIKGDDVLVGDKKVGSFTAEGDQIEFTDTEGNTKTFDNDEEMIGYVTGLNEDVKLAQKRKEDRLKTVHNRPHDKPSKVGDYVKHELSKHHKDSRMDNPSNHEHGHDDPSGKKLETSGSKGGELPPDKESLDSKHAADTEYKDHGHDDKSGIEGQRTKGSDGSNPPDKEKDLKNKEHKTDIDTSDHGHDDPKSGKNKVNAAKKGK